MSTERGGWIIYEGPGMCGKSTQTKFTHKFLNSNGFETIQTREPGGTPDAELIREFIFTLKGQNSITPDQQVALFFASRYVSIPNVVVPAVESGKYAISDRSYPSTMAYQGYAEGASKQIIEKMAELIVAKYEVRPSGVVLLNISIDEFVKRRELSGTDGDPFDDQKLEYTQRVINGYQQMAAESWGGLDWYVINGEQPVEQVTSEVEAALWEIVNKD